MDCTLLSSSVCGISKARILEWVAISFSGGLPNPKVKPASLALAGGWGAPITIYRHPKQEDEGKVENRKERLTPWKKDALSNSTRDGTKRKCQGKP